MTIFERAGQYIALAAAFVDKHNGAVSAIAAVFIAIFTIVLALVSRRQARLTRDAVKVAVEHAGHAQRAIAVTEMASQQQLRAYVAVEFSVSPMVTVGMEHAHSWLFNIIWKNTGDTPTRDLISHTSARLEASDTPVDFRYPDVWMIGRPQVDVPSALAPSYSMVGETIPIFVEQLRDVKEGRKFFHIYGWVDYNDVFKNTRRHRTEYCVQVTVPGEPHMPSVANIHFLVHREHNGMDKECMREPTTTVARRRIEPLSPAS